VQALVSLLHLRRATRRPPCGGKVGPGLRHTLSKYGESNHHACVDLWVDTKTEEAEVRSQCHDIDFGLQFSSWLADIPTHSWRGFTLHVPSGTPIYDALVEIGMIRPPNPTPVYMALFARDSQRASGKLPPIG
jgi:hypothetical protein